MSPLPTTPRKQMNLYREAEGNSSPRSAYEEWNAAGINPVGDSRSILLGRDNDVVVLEQRPFGPLEVDDGNVVLDERGEDRPARGG